MRDTIYWFIKNRTYALGNQGDISSGDGHSNRLSNDIALDISFGTIGYSLVLSRAFKKVSVGKEKRSVHAQLSA